MSTRTCIFIRKNILKFAVQIFDKSIFVENQIISLENKN